jgi:EAL domain-containing protein (putative c-di-GMP-specific phosphodiesterase class I)
MEFSPQQSRLNLLVLSTCEQRLGDLRLWLNNSRSQDAVVPDYLLMDPHTTSTEPPLSPHWQAVVLLIDHIAPQHLQWLSQLPVQLPFLIISTAEHRQYLPQSGHWLALNDFSRHRFFQSFKPLQLQLRSDIPAPLQRNEFFRSLRQQLTGNEQALYLQVLQCRWLRNNREPHTWQQREDIQQEFERTISLRAPAGAIVGRILDDQLIVISDNYYQLQADWLPLQPDDDERPWVVYYSSPLCINDFAALSAVLQEGVQQIARERLVQESQFEWRQQDTSLSLLDGMHLALQRDEFYLEYQPQFDSRSGALVGAEALMRWRHPTLGVIPPTVFIQEAENAGLIQALGHWALRETAKAWCQLQKLLEQPLRMAVNVSFPEVADPSYAQQVIDLLDQIGMPPQYLELELTETAMMRDASVSLLNLRQLKAVGIHIVLDDFGTGFSSLSHLSDLPLTGIKLDRAFVSPLPDHGPQTHIVTTMLELAKKLRLETTAEGVEDRACLEVIRHLGCDRIQGYIYAQPLPLEELISQARQGFKTNSDFNQGRLF